MSDQNPAPGWYPAPHANNEQRYWDGVQWLEPQPPAAVPTEAPTAVLPAYPHTADAPIADAPTAVFPGAPASPDGYPVAAPGFANSGYPVADPGAVAPKPKSKKKGWIIGGSIVAGVVIIASIATAIGGGGKSDVAEDKPDSSTVTTEDEPAAVMVTVPDVTGQTATEALVTLAAAGLTPPAITALADPLAKVLSTSPAAGAEVEEGAEVTLTLEEKPAFTVAQQNAIDSAQGYLEYSGFSRTGLIGQLEFEGFSTEEATFGVDNAGADWNAEAAETAQQYLDYSSFSRQGLYDQLAYEGFLAAEIEYGLAAVGY